jgi:hypothetical protein
MRKVLFFSSVEGVADAYPIKPAREFKFKWVEAAQHDYKNYLKSNLPGTTHHLRRCPGIFELMDTGWIVPIPWDFVVKTERSDSNNFGWEIPSGDILHIFPGEPASGHMGDGIARSLPKKPNTLESIVKINTPWSIAAPEGVRFLIIPLPYPDSYEFESTMGILDPATSTEVNFQLRWNVLNGEHLIKAGTPMMQIIPLTDEKFETIVRDATEDDNKWLKRRRYLQNNTFILDKPMLRKVYNKFFGPKLK